MGNSPREEPAPTIDFPAPPTGRPAGGTEQNSAGPDVPASMAQAANLDRSEWLSMARFNQRERWRHGERVQVEALLKGIPALQGDSEGVLDLILNEVYLREEKGETPQIEEYEQRFPEFAGKLRRHFDLYKAMREAPSQASAGRPDGGATELASRAGVEETAQPRLPEAGGTGQPEVRGYEILGELGRGGMGVVYKARQQSLNRVVALKMVLAGAHAGRDELARFFIEAQAVAQLQHPNIVQIYEVGDQDGRPYFSLEFVDSGSLDDKYGGKPVSARPAAVLVEQLARAMHFAHCRGIIHRDLKPANVLLMADGTPKITDFGLAKRLDSAGGQTQTGDIMGTPSYMAPEQASGSIKQIGPGTDIYALGTILYDLLTGRPPFQATSLLETLEQVRSQEPLPPRRLQMKLPRDLETICLKCLHKEPRKRYATAEALADDLRRFLNGEAIQARPTPAWERSAKWVRRRPAMATLLASCILGALLLIGSGLVYHTRISEARDEAERALKDSQEQMLRLYVANGVRLMNEGNLYDALVWFAEALQRDEKGGDRERMHRIRLAAVLGRCPLLKQIVFHQAAIRHAEFSPDGDRLVTASDDGTARVWDVYSGAPIGPALKHEGAVVDATFSPDGKRLATASEDGSGRVWDVDSGRLISRFAHKTGQVYDVAFCPDGRRVVTAGEDGAAWIWDAATGKPLAPALQHSGPVRHASFSPDGGRVVTGSADSTARVWDAATGKQVAEFTGHKGTVFHVEFDRDGRHVVSASADRTARVWDAATGQPVGEPLRHLSEVTVARFSPEGDRVLTCSEDMTAQVWGAKTGQRIGPPLQHRAAVKDGAFSPNGQHVVTASDDNTARVWDATTSRPLLPPIVHNATVYNASFNRKGDRLVTAGDDCTAAVWTTQPRDPKPVTVMHDKAVNYAEFSPDGRRFVTASADHTARIWDTATGQLVAGPFKHGEPVNHAVFSPDGRQLVTASADSTARIWDLAGNGCRILQHKGPVNAAVFSPDGRQVLTASADQTARVWDAVSGKPSGVVLQHAKGVNDAIFSPDGKWVATASEDGTARVWDAATGSPRTPPLVHQRRVNSVAFSPDSQRVVTASDDQSARVWDAATGGAVGERLMHASPVWSARFDPSGQRVITTGSDNTARIWDPNTSRLLVAPLVHNGTVRDASFSAHGHRVVTASEDHTGRVWDTRLGEALTPALTHGTWGKVLHAAFSPDDHHVVTASEDGTARVWTLRVNEQPVEDLKREALLLAGKTIDDRGRLVPLEAKDIHQAWSERK